MNVNVCPYCQHENLAGVLVCASCGRVMQVDWDPRTLTADDLPQEFIDQLKALSARHKGPLNRRSNIIIHFVETDRSLTLWLTNIIVLGRRVTSGLNQPDLDLTPYDAHQKGVSRFHAALDLEDGWLTLADLGSRNGTYVNGLKLRPHEPVVLQNDDIIQLGRLLLSVSYASDKANP